MSEPGIDQLITVAQAAGILDLAEVSPRQELVALADALWRRLAEDVQADRDYPPLDKSLMDGFAVRAGEAAGEFELLGEIHAGEVWRGKPLRGRQAVAIMTGAPLPPTQGEVGIVPVEESQRIGQRAVMLRSAAVPGRYISRRGADRRAGETVLTAGTIIGPQHISVLASVGRSRVCVFARPRCCVLATGDELVATERKPEAHQIRNSNSPALLALLERLGADVVDGGHVRDDLDATRHALGEWLQSSCDCLFVTGGMSMGERDYVPRVLAELGVALRITKLKIKPGKPFVFGVRTRERGFVAGSGHEQAEARRGRHTTYVFGLPGNPVSSYVCTLVLAARLMERLGGAAAQELERRVVRMPLAAPLGENGPRQFYQPARIVSAEGGSRLVALDWRGSADVFTLAQAEALIERPASEGPKAAGDLVRAIRMP